MYRERECVCVYTCMYVVHGNLLKGPLHLLGLLGLRLDALPHLSQENPVSYSMESLSGYMLTSAWIRMQKAGQLQPLPKQHTQSIPKPESSHGMQPTVIP